MKFLVTALTRQPVPPDLALGLVEAMRNWLDIYTATGKIEQVWGFAGLPGGGGIVNFESHEELHKFVLDYPFQPFAEIEVQPLAEISTVLDQLTKQLQAMAALATR